MLVISPQQPCGIGRYSLVSGNGPMRASDPTNHLQCLPQSIKVSPRRDEVIQPYRLLALPAAYYKKALWGTPYSGSRAESAVWLASEVRLRAQ